MGFHVNSGKNVLIGYMSPLYLGRISPKDMDPKEGLSGSPNTVPILNLMSILNIADVDRSISTQASYILILRPNERGF